MKDTFLMSFAKDQAQQVTEKLIIKMKEFAESHHAEFIVAPVSLEDKKWLDIFKAMNINTIECDSPTMHTTAYKLSDGHPNEKWSEEFAGCLT